MSDVQLEQEVQAQAATFNDYHFSDNIHQDLRAAGFEKPTPIQAQCIPIALEGKDMIGLAQTGTGKTAAFALPIIQKLAQSTDLAALVLVPTRELANQVTAVFNQLGKASGIRVATIVGGIPMDNDYKALRSWPNILVATPGRLIDHLTYRSVSLSEIQMLVVDEADRMHDMGFIPQIRRILSELPEKRQTMMFTATMPSDVERIARMSMKDPVRIQVGFRCAPAEGAEQQLFAVSDEEKNPLLMKLLGDRIGNSRVLVFVRTKRGVDKLHRIVSRRFNAARIHGDREQCERDEAMNGFREGRHSILIATDIAARGIDVANIEHVINYDFPLSAEDYVHRIGRTARQQATGLAISFVTPNDRRYVQDVKKLLGDKLPLPEDLEAMLGKPGRRSSGRREGSRGEPRAEGMEGGGARGRGGRRGGRSRSQARPEGSPEVASQGRAEGLEGQVQQPPTEGGEPNGNVQTQATDQPPRRRRRRGGRGKGKAGGSGQPQPQEAA